MPRRNPFRPTDFVDDLMHLLSTFYAQNRQPQRKERRHVKR